MAMKRAMIESGHARLSVRRQCELIGLNRSSWYAPASPVAEFEENVRLMHRIDEHYTAHPFYGSRKLVAVLRREGWRVNRKRVQRLMRKMGIASVAPAPGTGRAHPEHRHYPYLLRGVSVARPNQVWSTDVTYIRLEHGFAYLVAVIDWYSRKVLAWRLANTLETGFCLEALTEALDEYGTPEIFNTDQGCQFTSAGFTGVLKAHDIRISMDGKGRALDNIFVERLWRSVKYEDVYLKHYDTMREARDGLTLYFRFYNLERPHQALNDQTPSKAYGNFSPLPVTA
jgi:putative transposase